MKTLGMLASVIALGAIDPAPVRSSLTCNGYDDDYFDDLGALQMGAPFAMPFGGGRPMAPQRYAQSPQRYAPSPRTVVPRQYLIPQNPGVPRPGLKLQPLGLSSISFTATSGTALNMTASPQRPFKAKRLIIDFTRSGATATGLVTVTSINVGTDNQLVGSGPLPAAAFAVTAFDANIEFAPATPGIEVSVGVSITAAPTMTDTIDVAGALFGTSLG